MEQTHVAVVSRRQELTDPMDAALFRDVFAEAADPCRELVARNSRNGPCHALSFALRHYQPPHHCLMSPFVELPCRPRARTPLTERRAPRRPLSVAARL